MHIAIPVSSLVLWKYEEEDMKETGRAKGNMWRPGAVSRIKLQEMINLCQNGRLLFVSSSSTSTCFIYFLLCSLLPLFIHTYFTFLPKFKYSYLLYHVPFPGFRTKNEKGLGVIYSLLQWSRVNTSPWQPTVFLSPAMSAWLLNLVAWSCHLKMRFDCLLSSSVTPSSVSIKCCKFRASVWWSKSNSFSWCVVLFYYPRTFRMTCEFRRIDLLFDVNDLLADRNIN